MASPIFHHEDRLLPCDNNIRTIARDLYEHIRNLPIVSPHGHTNPAWFALNKPFNNALDLLITPDHYILRMLYSQGVPLEKLGVSPLGQAPEFNPREGWLTFANHYHLFYGTPSYIWLNHVFAEVFEIDVLLSPETADHYYDIIDAALKREKYLPRNLFDKFDIAFLATTESATDPLTHHKFIHESGWKGNVVSTYRPDNLTNPEHPEFKSSLIRVGEQTNEDVYSWQGYLAAHRKRRAFFRNHGATATDHGHPTAMTADLSEKSCEELHARIVNDRFTSNDAELFRAQMLTKMAEMSLEDGMTMQLHPGVYRNHNRFVFERFGRDKGGDIPLSIDYIKSLHPLLSRYGNEKDLTLILFTLDETAYSRELAPLAGHYPALRLGPAWWFHDSPEGMMRYRERTTEIAGFYNTVGFNDDTRAFFSIPARHDMARRIDCAWLARLVGEHRLSFHEATDIAFDLTVTLPRMAYKIKETAL